MSQSRRKALKAAEPPKTGLKGAAWLMCPARPQRQECGTERGGRLAAQFP